MSPPALLLAILLIAAALAACGGDSPDADRERTAATPRTEATETGDAEPEPTGGGIFGSGGSQPTAQPEATETGDASGSDAPGGAVRATREARSDESSGMEIKYEGRASGDWVLFASVSAGGSHTCRVRSDGPVACWGLDDEGQATPPEGQFASVNAGGRHTCGVRTDGSVVCWGN